jgi:molecular chaperone GrpE (heat shock protein)
MGEDTKGTQDTPTRRAVDVVEALEEIAEDTLHLMERTGAIDTRLGTMADQVGRMVQLLEERLTADARAVDQLRRDLLGERREQSARQSFDAVVPAVDALRAMHDGLDPACDERMRIQVAGVIGLLGGLLQRLGFVEFSAQPGEAFDPSRMLCLGNTDGPAGRVVAAIQPGFLAHDAVARPAGVLVGTPAPSTTGPRG